MGGQARGRSGPAGRRAAAGKGPTLARSGSGWQCAIAEDPGNSLLTTPARRATLGFMQTMPIRSISAAAIPLAMALAAAPAQDAPPSEPPAGSGLPLVAEGARVELLADGFQFTEGPAVDPDGNVYFTDQPNDRILKWSVEGRLETFMQPAGRSNGLYFERDGKLLACADERSQLWRIDPADGSKQVLVDGFEDRHLNGPNDVWVHPDGTIYFTDPFYKRPYWERNGEGEPARGVEREQAAERVYRLEPDGSAGGPVVAAEGFERPNGIVGTPDGRTLYVADIGAGRTYAFPVADDGTLGERRLFCEMGSDGMTLDADGNLYLTGKGVTVFDKDGGKVGHLPIDEGWTANVCFGGRDRTTLFITAMDSLYAVRMAVQGAAPPRR